MQAPEPRISIQTRRLFTIGLASLCAFSGLIVVGMVTTLVRNVLGEDNRIPITHGHIALIGTLAAWTTLALLFYQVRETSSLDVAARKMCRRYSLFGVTLVCVSDDLSRWTWLQPRPAHTGSRRLVIDAGNSTERNRTHLIEMPPEATWKETVDLGKLIADCLSIECRPYHDRLTGVSSFGADTLV